MDKERKVCMRRKVVYLDDVLFRLFAIQMNTMNDAGVNRMINLAIENTKRDAFEIETDSKEGDLLSGGSKNE